MFYVTLAVFNTFTSKSIFSFFACWENNFYKRPIFLHVTCLCQKLMWGFPSESQILSSTSHCLKLKSWLELRKKKEFWENNCLKVESLMRGAHTTDAWRIITNLKENQRRKAMNNLLPLGKRKSFWYKLE